MKRVPVTLVPTVEKMVPVDPFERRGAQMKVDSDYKFKTEDGTIFDSIEAMIEHFKTQRCGARRKTRRNKRRISRRHNNAKRSGR